MLEAREVAYENAGPRSYVKLPTRLAGNDTARGSL